MADFLNRCSFIICFNEGGDADRPVRKSTRETADGTRRDKKRTGKK